MRFISIFHKHFILAALCVLGLSSSTANAWWPFTQAIDSLSLTIFSKSLEGCVHDLSISWATEGTLKRWGERHIKLCNTEFGPTLISNSELPTNPLVVTWLDEQNQKHTVEIDTQAALAGHELYGGSLTIRISSRNIELRLAERNRTKITRSLLGFNKEITIATVAF